MKSKEIATQYLSLIDAGGYDPQSAKIVDFMDDHRTGIKTNNVDTASAAIVLPAHNEARLLPRCLAGINHALLLNNQQANVIVVDNASSDATSEIAKYFGATVVPEPKKGIGQARQSGLLSTNSANELILTTDSDSVVPNNWIEAHRERLEDPLVSFSGGGIQLIIDQDISTKQKLGFYIYLAGRRAIREFKLVMSSRYFPANGGNSAFRRSEAIEMGGYRTDLAAMEDYFIMLDLIEKYGAKAARTNTLVMTSARRILEAGILKMAKMRVEDNIGILSNKPQEQETYEDYRPA